MYWGPNPKYYGACRRGNAWRDRPQHGPGTFNPRFDNTPIYVHKGWSNFWPMYEETGDPRYRHAAEAAADWSIRHQDAGTGEARVIGVVADAVKMYEYTGDRKHLDNAVRLWKTFQPFQGPDLLFTQNNKPAVGNDLYIGSDAAGYKTPFVKPYIVQYAANALPYLLVHSPADQRFAPRFSPSTTGWPACNNLVADGVILTRQRPVSAGTSSMCTACFWPTGSPPRRNIWMQRPAICGQSCNSANCTAGLRPESTRGRTPAKIGPAQRQQRYRLATDRDAMRDYTEGRIRFGQTPDNAVHFQIVLRDYLMHRDETSLFERDEMMKKIVRLPATLP